MARELDPYVVEIPFHQTRRAALRLLEAAEMLSQAAASQEQRGLVEEACLLLQDAAHGASATARALTAVYQSIDWSDSDDT